MEETVYDEVVTCDHSYDKRCHTSYVTSFVSVQEEECDENFKKVRVWESPHPISPATRQYYWIIQRYWGNQKLHTISFCEMSQ